jgi:electron transfer flavoprotein alpha subunit
MRLIELVVQQSFTEEPLPESLLGLPALDLISVHAHHLIVVAKSDVADLAIRQRYGLNQYDSVLVMSCSILPHWFTHEQLLDVFAQGIRRLGLGQETCVFLSRTDVGLNDVISGLACLFDGYASGTVERISTDAENSIVLKKTGFGGRLYLHQKVTERWIFLTLRHPNRPLTRLCKDSGECVWTREEIQSETLGSNAKFLPSDEALISLAESSVIVAGGRGMKSLDSFDLLHELAAEIGGMVAASLPAVDAGWASVTRQVGQSGQYVRPDMYIAFGISGTPQHLAGIDPLTTIYAVNKDKDAHIFNVAQLGVVESCETFLPLLLQELRQLKRSRLIHNSKC